jgi:hypothetical protein
MNWEQWFCRSPFCRADGWMAMRAPDQTDLWWLGHDPGDRSYTVAAVDPVCPLCGTTLSIRIEVEQAVGAEAGSIFDFARTLVW